MQAIVSRIFTLAVAIAQFDAIRDVAGGIVLKTRQRARALPCAAKLSKGARLRAHPLLAHSLGVEQDQAAAVAAPHATRYVTVAARANRHGARGLRVTQTGARVAEAIFAAL